MRPRPRFSSPAPRDGAKWPRSWVFDRSCGSTLRATSMSRGNWRRNCTPQAVNRVKFHGGKSNYNFDVGDSSDDTEFPYGAKNPLATLAPARERLTTTIF